MLGEMFNRYFFIGLEVAAPVLVTLAVCDIIRSLK